MKSLAFALLLSVPFPARAGTCAIEWHPIDGYCLVKHGFEVACVDESGWWLPDEALGRWSFVRIPVSSPIAELLALELPVSAGGQLSGSDESPCDAPFSLLDWLMMRPPAFRFQMGPATFRVAIDDHIAIERALQSGAKMMPY
jgi:hypothetical protein